MLDNGGRAALADLTSEGGRYCVGTINASDEGITCEGADVKPRTEIWSRADNGWGQDLCRTDRIIKNVWEVLSPLNLITAERPLDSHEFLTPDCQLQRTRFGDLTITVAYSRPASLGDNQIPPYGFVIESPTFIAFCATKYNGIEYAGGALFTAHALDGKPLAQSARVRIFHGFGPSKISLCGKQFDVQREAEVSVAG